MSTTTERTPGLCSYGGSLIDRLFSGRSPLLHLRGWVGRLGWRGRFVDDRAPVDRRGNGL